MAKRLIGQFRDYMQAISKEKHDVLAKLEKQAESIEGKESNITGMLADGTISAAQQRLLLIKLEELDAEHQGVLVQMDVILNLVPFVYRRNFTRYQRRMNRKELRRSFYGK